MKNIKMVIIDVDGVLTDGKIIVDAKGEEVKNFHVRDGTGIKYLQRAGLNCAVISGRKCTATEHRLRELGIKDIFQNAVNKIEAYEQIVTKYNLKDEEVCYIGDDLIDIPIFRRVGFSAAVPDAPHEVKEIATYITKTAGGQGAVREVIEKILKFQDKWEIIMARYI
ncbi:MAG TPA: HAD-IIIA family hydrolase [Candidatus Brocadiales bacterium]|nr:HAD-IIIA family hydrolase [Candidatus Brocadiales bacterium]